MSSVRFVFLLSLASLTALSQTRDPGPVPRFEVKRATTAPQIDGKLDDDAWKNAQSVTLQFPWEQQTGAKQKTSARLLWDDHNLYVGYECEDNDITAKFTERDDPTYRDDAVEIFINPDPKQKDFYYGLEMNARGTLYDYFYAFPKLLLKRINFSGVQLRTQMNGTLNQSDDQDAGWTLELAIPWSNFEELTKAEAPRPGTIWRANINRWDGTEPKRRLSVWSDSAQPRPSPHNPERFGELVFIQ
jgi:hypothetical protein